MSEQQAIIPLSGRLKLEGNGFTLSILPEAVKRRDDLLAVTEGIQAIASADDAATVKAHLDKLAAFRNELDKTRLDVKRPVLDVGKAIDETAAAFGVPLAKEEPRLRALLNGYLKEQERIREEERKKLDDQKRELERLRLEAEAAARAVEAEKNALDSKPQTIADFVRLAEVDEAQKKAAAAVEAQTTAAVSTIATLTATTAVVAPKVISFEVVDIVALYKAHPQLVELNAKKAEVKAFLKTMDNNGLPLEVPGLKITKDFKA